MYSRVTEIARLIQTTGRTSPHRAFWATRDGQQSLSRYFDRVGAHLPTNVAILEAVLRTACGKREMYERQAREAACVLLGVLTHPYAAHVPPEEFPAIAERLCPKVLDVIELDVGRQLAIIAALAHYIGVDRSDWDLDTVIYGTLDEIGGTGFAYPTDFN